jgi:hypothetical protein
MEEPLHQIRAALEAGATQEARIAGIQACATIAAALGAARTEAPPASPPPSPDAIGQDSPPPQSEHVAELCDPGEVPPVQLATEEATAPPLPSASPLTPSVPSALGVGGLDPAIVAAVVAKFRSLTPEQWIDLAIEKLTMATRNLPPAFPSPPQVAPLSIGPSTPQPLRFHLVPIPPTRAPSAKPQR